MKYTITQYVKFFAVHAALYTLLFLGLIGVNGAFNVYTFVVILYTAMYMFLWVDEIRDTIVEKILQNQANAPTIPSWLRRSAIAIQAVILVWFDHFALGACLVFLIWTVAGRIDPVIEARRSAKAEGEK